jgi:hypothetical protein
MLKEENACSHMSSNAISPRMSLPAIILQKNKMNSLSTYAGRFQAAFGGKETGWGRSQAAITR